MTWISQLAGWQLGLLGIYGFVVFLALLRNVIFFDELRRTPFLTPHSPPLDIKHPPFVSIVVPARDESAVIDACLKSLVAQDYPNFEIVVIDDRSQDDTAALVSRWAHRDSRIRLLRNFDLPTGWTGKSHALHVAQKETRGEWLFFVDADASLHPSCVSLLMNDCMLAGADMESLVPTSISGSFWCRLAQPIAASLLLVLYRPNRVNRGTSRNSGFAVGALMLVRKSAYDAIGGHEAVRDAVVEDIQLARNARSHGIRLRVTPATQLASVRMYSTVGGFVSGWGRIFYSAAELGVSRLWRLTGLVFAFNILPYAILLATGTALLTRHFSPFVSAALLLGLTHETLNWGYYAQVFAGAKTSLSLLPLRLVGVFIIFRVLGRSIRMCRTHEVTWRGTSYTVELRHGAQDGSTA